MQIVYTPTFKRKAKHLAKKYPSFKSDLELFGKSLLDNPYQGVLLNNGFRKIRMAITSKGKGKRGGARVITLNLLCNNTVDKIILITLYDKNEQQSITEQEIKEAYNTLN